MERPLSLRENNKRIKIMKKIIILSVIVASLYAAVAFAQTSVKAEVDKTSLSTDEALTYKLTITSLEKNIPTPQLPKFTGLKVITSTQSSSVTFTKGSVKTILVYVFVLVPTEAGKFKIEPSTIKIKNEAFSTGDFEIQVKQGKLKSGVEPRQKPPPEKTQPEETEQPQIIL